MKKYMNHIIELYLTMLVIQFNKNKLKSNRQRNRKTNKQTFRGIELLQGQSQKGIRLLSNKSIVFNYVDNKVVKHCTKAMHNRMLLTILQQNTLVPFFRSGSEFKHSTFQICISSCMENLINSLFKFKLDNKNCKEFTKI